MSRDFLSVIISVYNAASTIHTCLSTLEQQTIPHEVIVVDDGSTDNTQAILKKFPSIVVLKVSHQGPARARNQGVKQAKGNILVFVDADMTFAPDFLEKLTAPIRAHQVSGTFTKAEYVKNFDSVLARAWNYEYTHQMSKSRFPANYPDEAPVFRAILKSEFLKADGFDAVGYNDDWTLSKKLHYQAAAVYDAVLYHDNPDTWITIWHQAQWVGKRQYKWGSVGRIIAFGRASLPFSLIYGIKGVVASMNWYYLPFKIWYDSAIMWGILQVWITGNHAK